MDALTTSRVRNALLLLQRDDPGDKVIAMVALLRRLPAAVLDATAPGPPPPPSSA